MTQVRFTLLGCGNSAGVPRLRCDCDVCSNAPIGSKNRRQRVAALFEIDGKRLLIDAGPDIRNQMLENGVGEIDALLITHHHFDHIACMDDVRYMGNTKERTTPLYCNHSTHKYFEKWIGYLCRSSNPDFPYPPFTLHEVRPWQKISFAGVKIQTVSYTQQNEGHSHPTEVLGVRVGELAFITDIKQYPDRLIKELKGVKTLILGAVRESDSIAHFTFDQAIEFAHQVGAEQTYFIHLDHSVDYERSSRKLPPGFALGYDGLHIEYKINL